VPGLRLAYVLLSYLLVPLLLAHLLWRSRSLPGYRRRIRERFGFGLPRIDRPAIWVHAVSVGEVQAAAPLVRALIRQFPDDQVLMTTMTPTGSERARALFGDSVAHCYVPYDLASAVRRFFSRIRPRLAIIMETELWPNLYHECGQRKVPLVLASARVSARSLRHYRRLVPLFRDTLANGIVIAAQTTADAQRFISLGASPGRTYVTGNIKFDFELPSEVIVRGREFRARHAHGRPVWIAASTHEGEEQAALAAHRAVLARHPAALLLLVPRHPERFPAVAALIGSAGFSQVLRSSERITEPATQVFLGNCMGELTMFYGAADVAFVGGSLVAAGGHNLLEPAALGLPLLAGPHNENSADIAELLTECGAAQLVHGPDELASAVIRLLDDRNERERRGTAGRDAIAASRGTLDRLLALVQPLAADRQGGAGRVR
jgi:3-deoxy-D-manno-octulosonic-acid transferase